MFFSLLTVLGLLGYFLGGPACLFFLALLAVAIKLAPVLIGLAVIAAAAAWAFNHYRR
tara:strand:- start:9621 stop:9794 length:174 start_codon:yes stop_codon:yes gene_type:complete